MTDVQLSLVIRKSIRDNEAKRDENLEKLQKYFNLTERPTFESPTAEQWAEIDAGVDKGYKNRAGELVYNYNFGGFCSGVQKAFTGGWNKSAACRDAFAVAWTTKIVRLKLDAKEKPRHFVTLEEGVLVIHTSPKSIATNVDDIGAEPSVMSTVGPLTIDGFDWRYRFCFDKTAGKKIEEACAKIKAATGLPDVSYVHDWNVLGPHLQALDAGKDEWNWRSPDWIAEAVHGLAGRLEKGCKDAMVKEALLEKWKTGKIVSLFMPNLKDVYPGRLYHASDLKDGNLVIAFARSSNISYFGEDIEHRL